MSSLARIEQSVRASDGEAILARWDFGRKVLEQRVGKQLPSGMLVKILSAVGISQRELAYRTRVAEHWDREELSNLLLSSPMGWTALIADLPKKRQQGARSPKPPSLGPTAATLAEADRFEVLIAKPDVAAEIKRRAKTDAAARKAAAYIERQERAEAKVQKERDQETQQMQQVLRMRLVRGDADWVDLTELYETMTDTIKRHLKLVDGLPIPEGLQRKLLERQLHALQQALFELDGRLFPNNVVRPAGDVWRTSVIDVP